MHVSTFILADHAEAVNGKLYVMGGAWNRIGAPQFPVVHNHLSVGVVIHVPWEETNARHPIELRLIDSDGAPLIPEPLAGNIEAGRPPGMRPGDEQLVVMAFNFNGLTFERPGTYEFHLLADALETALLRFDVVALDKPSAPA
jgi:hypothetical protein